MPTIKKSVDDFMSREQRLDVLTNSESALFATAVDLSAVVVR